MRLLSCLPLLCCLTLFASPTLAEEERSFDVYPDGVYTTTIGEAEIPVILKPGATAPVVEVQLWVHAGAKHEPAPIRGISHYLEHLFYRGTPKRGPLENRLEIIDVGGVTTAGTWYDWTYYRNKVRSADVERGIDTLTDSLMDLTLAPEAVEAERSVVGSEIRLREDDPGIYAWEESMRLLYPDHPYGERVIGDFETTGRITQADFRDYYQRSYHPKNVVWVVVGDFEPEAILLMLEERLGHFSRPAEPYSAPVIDSAHPGFRIALNTKPVSEPTVTLAFRMPGFRHPDRPACEALAHMLVEREDSLLETIRLEGAAGTVSGGYTVLEDGGLLTLEATPGEGKTLEYLVAEMASVVEELVKGFNPNYLVATKQSLVNQIESGLDTTDRQAYALGIAHTQGLFLDYWKHAGWIDDLTAEQVADAARKWLVKDNAALVVVASEEFYRMDSVFRPSSGIVPDPVTWTSDLQHALTIAIEALPDSSNAPDMAASAEDKGGGLRGKQIAFLGPRGMAEPALMTEILSNGGRLVLRIVPGATRTSLGIYFGKGSADYHQAGALDLTLALLQFGGDTLDRNTLLARITGMGGSLSHYVDRRESGVELSVPSDQASAAVELFRTLLTQQGLFREDDIPVAFQTQGSERRAAFDDIRRRAGQGLWEMGLGGDFAVHPKGQLPLDGPEASVPPPPPTAADLRILWKALLNETTAIVISGDFPSDIGDLVEGLLPVPGKPIVSWQSRTLEDLQSGSHQDALDRTQAAVYLLGRAEGIGSSSPDYAAAQVLARGLGLRNFRDLIYAQALAYSSSAQLLDAGNTGAIALFAYVDPLNAAKAREELRKKVDDVLENGFPAQELANVKGWWLGSLAVGSEDQGTMARRIGSYSALGLGWDYQPKFEAAISAVTEADIKRVAQKVFGNRDQWLELVVGPMKGADED